MHNKSVDLIGPDIVKGKRFSLTNLRGSFILLDKWWLIYKTSHHLKVPNLLVYLTIMLLIIQCHQKQHDQDCA